MSVNIHRIFYSNLLSTYYVYNTFIIIRKIEDIRTLKRRGIRKLASCFGELLSSREEICSAGNKLICKT